MKYLIFWGLNYLWSDFWGLTMMWVMVLYFIAVLAGVSGDLMGSINLNYLVLMLISLTLIVMTVVFVSGSMNWGSLLVSSSYALMMLVSSLFLLLAFSVQGFLSFYLMFEISILPVFLLILGWGYSVERFQAALYMFIYTLVSSLPFLFLILFWGGESGVWGFFLKSFLVSDKLEFFYWVFLMVVFMVKAPVFMVHLWLPKAHVEAPLVGSMLLAGILLKLGGYGLIQFMELGVFSGLNVWSMWLALFLYGSLLVGLMCIRQVDIKVMIAYSSVVHMSLVIGGIMSLNCYGLSGAILMMLGHGFCSSGLFFMLNSIYERMGSRSFFILRGGLLWGSVFSFLWFTMCVINLSAPPSMNFVSEVLLMLGIFNIHFLLAWGGGLYLFVGGIYCIYMFVIFAHGGIKVVGEVDSLTFREVMIVMFHLIPLMLSFFIGLFINYSKSRMISVCGIEGYSVLLGVLIGFLFLGFHLTFFYFFVNQMGGMDVFLNFTLMEFGVFPLVLVLIFDWMSVLFSMIVFLISGVVMIYSYFYMMGDSNYKRFLILLVLFVLSMIFVILIPNLVIMMLGWDGLGLISFCLVIYYLNYSSLKSGLLTIYMNRVGDIFLLLTILLLLDVGIWSGEAGLTEKNLVVVYLLVLAGMTSSAQIPFSVWLPAAMAAPTPVSSLVHSSTLVTAGVYLIMRHWFWLMDVGLGSFFLVIGGLTMLMAGFAACLEKDMKKVVAMSTLSQLGLMMFVLFQGEREMSFMHMSCHALFKALLFLCCGIMIINSYGMQDSRSMGSLGGVLYVGGMGMVGSSLSLMGFPFTSGFYSKDLMIELVFFDNFYWGSFTMLGGCLVTVWYSMRLIQLGVGMLKGGFLEVSGYEIFGVFLFISVLFVYMMMMGVVMSWELSIGSWWMVSIWPKLMGFMLVVGGVFVWLLILQGSIRSNWKMADMFFLKWISTGGISFFLLKFTEICGIDQLWGEIFGPSGMKSMLISSSNFIGSYVLSYMKFLVFLLWGVFIICFL